ncbi:MAG: ribonuclease Z [Microthrixaceae bacterium]
MLKVTLLGTGSPLPSADRAGPSTLVTAGEEHYLVDAGRGVLMRLAAAGLGAPNLTAVLLTHLHSDHITDLGDVITTRWVMTFAPSPLTIVGPPGTASMVGHLMDSLEADVAYRMAHHEDLVEPPRPEVVEVSHGPVRLGGSAVLSCAPTDHRPVEPSIGYRIESGGASVVLAGDTVPCDGLDELCRGAGALVHTVIRKDIISTLPLQRMLDTMDYHSSPAEAADTARRGGVGTLVLTHYVPEPPPGGEHEWREQAAAEFDGDIRLGDDLLEVEIEPG